MARYRVAPVGVIDQDNGNALILRGHAGWAEYELWLGAGNVADPLPPPPEPSLAERRQRRKNRVARYMRAAASTGVDAAGTHFRFDDFDLGVLHGAAIMVLAGDALPANFQWRDSTGTMVALTAAQLRTIVKQLASRQYALLKKRWDIDAAIEASANPESINPDDFGGL
jgi:Domain of unknown function (DUF4376)